MTSVFSVLIHTLEFGNLVMEVRDGPEDNQFGTDHLP